MHGLLKILGLILITIGLLVLPRHGASSADDVPTFRSYICNTTGNSYSLGSIFEINLNDTLFTRLPAKALEAGFSNFTKGQGVDQVYALYYCRGNVDHTACHACVQAAAQKIIQECKFLKEAIVWYDECTLRYANRSFFSLEQESPWYRYYNYTGNVSSIILDPYQNLFQSTMNSLINQAANNKSLQGFATTQVKLSSSESLGGLMQCTPDILGAPCYRCLGNALRQMDGWANTIFFMPSCLVRYDLYGSPPSIPPSTRRNLSVGYIVLIVLVSGIVILSLLGGLWFWKGPRTSQDPLIIEVSNPSMEVTEAWTDIAEPSERGTPRGLARFTYFQLEDLTNGFSRKLGEGGYGVVYYGSLTDGSSREVAVKVLSKNDAPTQFSTEIDVFGRISHKNLVSLVGYCDEGTHLALVYEYMSRGDLKALLELADSLSWKKRIEIAIDTAQGLDYLHNGISPPIVHRDVKPANILLNQDLRAKVADFGFSKIFPDEYVSNLSTRVVGTPGYVDPQYNLTGQLNEKGDVYSFGVVLLELITGRAAITRFTNLIQWVRPLLESGDIGSILDPKLRQDVNDNYNSIWKATELAMKCVTSEAVERPTMSQIVTELKECLTMEMHPRLSSTSPSSTEIMGSLVSDTLMGPTPR